MIERRFRDEGLRLATLCAQEHARVDQMLKFFKIAKTYDTPWHRY